MTQEEYENKYESLRETIDNAQEEFKALNLKVKHQVLAGLDNYTDMIIKYNGHLYRTINFDVSMRGDEGFILYLNILRIDKKFVTKKQKEDRAFLDKFGYYYFSIMWEHDCCPINIDYLMDKITWSVPSIDCEFIPKSFEMLGRPTSYDLFCTEYLK